MKNECLGLKITTSSGAESSRGSHDTSNSNSFLPVARSCLHRGRDGPFRICRGQDLAAHARERDPIPNLDLGAAGDRHAEADDVGVIAARPQNVAVEGALFLGSGAKEARVRQLAVAVQKFSKVACKVRRLERGYVK